nr:tetratricopeptide repeat protein [Kofleriaceae bacterium]
MATATDRESFDGQVARGSEALKSGRLDEATSAFKAALAIDPSNARVLALLGLSHFRANHLDMARPIYEDLVERLPTDASHRLNLGLVYLKVGDADRAITSLEASRALDPSQGRAVSYLGLAYARAGRYAEAYRSFLIAGQHDLAREIEQNLTTAERDGIHAQLGPSSPAIPLPIAPLPSAPVAAAPSARSASTPPPIQDAPIQDAAAAAPEPIAIPRTITTPPPPPKPRARISEPPRSMPAILVDKPPVPGDDKPPRMTESMQFVIGRGEVKAAHDISQAVAAATPAPAHLGGAIPLSQLATTELVQVTDDEAPFELTDAGALVIRVTERVVTRLDRVHVTGGDLTFESATRRSRGHSTEDRIDYGGTPMTVASGTGYLIALPADDREFVPVTLDDDILYLREDLLFAFQASLRWETGHVPGLRGQLPVVQFRGDGALVMRLDKPLVRVKLPPQGVLFVDVARLAGWIGRVIPRAVVPAQGGPLGDLCVECTGEGIVLVSQSAMPPLPVPPPPPPAPEPVPVREEAALFDVLGGDVLSESDAEHDAEATAPVASRSPVAGEPLSEAERSVADLMSDLDVDPHRDEI